MDNLDTITSGSWAADIIETAKATQGVEAIYAEGKALIVAHSKDQKITEIDIEKYLPAPTRIIKTINVSEATSFIDYWQTFATDASVILADLNSQKFTAVFDYHQPGKPAWESHKCVLVSCYSSEWQTWSGRDKKPFSQIEFAEFIESNAIDIIDPAAAVMIEVAMTLQANKKVKFNSGVRLDNGQIQLGYHEVIDGSAGAKGDLKIPDKFKLAIRIFQGGEKYEVECHLRYRINDGDLKFFYQVVRPERLLEDAFETIKKQVQTGCQGSVMLAVA